MGPNLYMLYMSNKGSFAAICTDHMPWAVTQLTYASVKNNDIGYSLKQNMQFTGGLFTIALAEVGPI